jgi:hypothetical protein
MQTAGRTVSTMDNDPVTRLLDAATAGTGVPHDLYSPDAVLDATVPMWRFEAHGAAPIAAELSRWYRDPGTLTEVQRVKVPHGETVRFTLEWVEDGQPWAAHQVHFLATTGGRITRHEAWCGGRWQAALLAEIEAGLQTARRAS